MLNYEELAHRATELDTKINEGLARKELLKTEEMVLKSKADYQRSAYIKKLHEKLNLVIMSRNKAQEANKRLLADFDRIQKHLAMMEAKTEVLMAKVNNEKTFLDAHYPNWREKATMFVSPSYITQENMFNMLDSLRCRLKESENVSFQSFPLSSKFSLNGHKSLASMFNEKEDYKNTYSSRESRDPISKSSPLSSADRQNQNVIVPDPIQIENKQDPIMHLNIPMERTIDTLTNITESVELPSNLRAGITNAPATEEAFSPRQSLNFSAESTTEPTSFVDPLHNALQFSYKLPSAVAAYEDDDLDTDFSEGNIENMLSPVKRAAANSLTHTPRVQSRPSSRENILESPGGSVDTVIRSPPGYQKSKPVIRLSTPINKMVGDDESEQQSITKPSKRKSALDKLNESSDSEIAFNNSENKEKSAADSEDDFDFFD